MGKWIAGVAGSVTVTLLVLYLTRVLEPRLPSYPRIVFAKASASFGTRYDTLTASQKAWYNGPFSSSGKERFLLKMIVTGKFTEFAVGNFTVSNEGNSRANMCNLHWTTDPSGLLEVEPSQPGLGVSWAKSELFSVPRNEEVTFTVTLDRQLGDTHTYSFFRVYCENGKSERYNFDIFKYGKGTRLNETPSFLIKP